jgi:hypothetical protein
MLRRVLPSTGLKKLSQKMMRGRRVHETPTCSNVTIETAATALTRRPDCAALLLLLRFVLLLLRHTHLRQPWLKSILRAYVLPSSQPFLAS